MKIVSHKAHKTKKHAGHAKKNPRKTKRNMSARVPSGSTVHRPAVYKAPSGNFYAGERAHLLKRGTKINPSRKTKGKKSHSKRHYTVRRNPMHSMMSGVTGFGIKLGGGVVGFVLTKAGGRFISEKAGKYVAFMANPLIGQGIVTAGITTANVMVKRPSDKWLDHLLTGATMGSWLGLVHSVGVQFLPATGVFNKGLLADVGDMSDVGDMGRLIDTYAIGETVDVQLDNVGGYIKAQVSGFDGTGQPIFTLPDGQEMPLSNIAGYVEQNMGALAGYIDPSPFRNPQIADEE